MDLLSFCSTALIAINAAEDGPNVNHEFIVSVYNDEVTQEGDKSSADNIRTFL